MGAALAAALLDGRIGPLGAALSAALYFGLAVLLRHALARRPPDRGFGIANAITLARATLVLFLAAFLGNGQGFARSGDAIAALALLSVGMDGLDGAVARRAGSASAFGARFDMEIDAFTMLVLSGLLLAQGRVGGWAVLPGLMRYALAGAAWGAPWLRRPLPPSDLRRWVCGLLGICLALAISPSLPVSAARTLVALGLIAVSFSFLRDILWLHRRR